MDANSKLIFEEFFFVFRSTISYIGIQTAATEKKKIIEIPNRKLGRMVDKEKKVKIIARMQLAIATVIPKMVLRVRNEKMKYFIMYAWDCSAVCFVRPSQLRTAARWSIIILFIAGQKLSWFSDSDVGRLRIYHRPIGPSHIGEQRIYLNCKTLGNPEVILMLRDRYIPFAPRGQTNEPISNVIGRICRPGSICQISTQSNDYCY